MRGAGLLLALDQQLEVDGGGGAAGGGEVGADAEGVEEDLALVVGRPARVEAVAAGRPARRGRCPSRPRGRRAARRGGRRRGPWGRPGRRRATRRRRPGAPGVPQTSAAGKPVSLSLAASQSALRRTSAAWSGWADTDGMRSHSARSSRKAARCCSMYVRTALSGVWLMVMSLSARADILGSGGTCAARGPGSSRSSRSSAARSGQTSGPHGLAGAHVEEGGRDGPAARPAARPRPAGRRRAGAGRRCGRGRSSSRRSRTSHRRRRPSL